MNFFEVELKELHYAPGQVKSCIAAGKIKSTDITKNQDGSYDIQGSGSAPYHATLSSCSCPDFQINKKRQAPCKHIYRIALDQDLIFMPKPNSAAKKQIDSEIPAETEKWRNAFLAGAIKPEKYVAIIEALTK